MNRNLTVTIIAGPKCAGKTFIANAMAAANAADNRLGNCRNTKIFEINPRPKSRVPSAQIFPVKEAIMCGNHIIITTEHPISVANRLREENIRLDRVVTIDLQNL